MISLTKLYLLSLLLISVPSLYFISPIFGTAIVAKVIWLLIFTIICYRLSTKQAYLSISKKLLLVFIIYFVSQSTSILFADNIGGFLQSYKGYLFAAIFFFISGFIIKDQKTTKNAVNILVVATVANLLMEYSILFYSNIFMYLGKSFVNDSLLKSIYFDIQRGRIFSAFPDEISIPLLFYISIKTKKTKKALWPTIISVLVSIMSFASGVRTRFFMVILSLSASVFISAKKSRIYLSLIFVFVFLFLGLNFIFSVSESKTVIDRTLPESNKEDINSISSGRFIMLKNATTIGLSYPLTGVGLGNYYNHLKYSDKKNSSVNGTLDTALHDMAITNPHNIFASTFAETGVIGLTGLLIALAYFIKTDYEILKSEKNELSKYIVASFWTLFFHSLFNPSYTVLYLSLFWGLRIYIEKSLEKKLG